MPQRDKPTAEDVAETGETLPGGGNGQTPPGEPGNSGQEGRPRDWFLPSTEEERRILAERAAMLAESDAEAAGGEYAGARLVRFTVGAGRGFAVSQSAAAAIVPSDKLAPVPCAPPLIAGVINRRGRLLTVLDTHELLGVQKPAETAPGQILVVQSAGREFGLATDSIDAEEDYSPNDLVPPPDDGREGAGRILGVHGGRVAVLDVDALFKEAEAAVATAAN